MYADASKLAARWLLSQKGICFEWPHRHSEKLVRVPKTFPAESTKSTVPVTFMDPLGLTNIVTRSEFVASVTFNPNNRAELAISMGDEVSTWFWIQSDEFVHE